MKKRIFCIVLAAGLIAGCYSHKDETDSAASGGGNSHHTPQAGVNLSGGVPEPNPDKLIEEMKQELGEEYIFDRTGYFVIAGNISKSEMERFREHTIKECADAMYKDFFVRKPDCIYKVYLFRDASSYEGYCMQKFGHRPGSPYGFFRDDSDSLIMNIATGGGTLVHEMVHALIRPDFPNVPAWFNEGLGSLFECCRIDDGSLRGEKNWRYPILMDAAGKGRLVPLRKLFATSDSEFYGDNSSVNYAQARYFCMYLQEKGFLPAFYRQFRDNYEHDKTGIEFIEALLGRKIDEIDRDWGKWIEKLK